MLINAVRLFFLHHHLIRQKKVVLLDNLVILETWKGTKK